MVGPLHDAEVMDCTGETSYHARVMDMSAHICVVGLCVCVAEKRHSNCLHRLLCILHLQPTLRHIFLIVFVCQSFVPTTCHTTNQMTHTKFFHKLNLRRVQASHPWHRALPICDGFTMTPFESLSRP